jgi:hypothetical protein
LARQSWKSEGGSRTGPDTLTAAAEDIVVLKAFSDRARDHEDLMKLIAVGGRKLDMPYIENWARELDRGMGGDEVTERLKRARSEAAQRTPASTRRRGGDS